MKDFIITIDTEGDNLWGWHEGDVITTENTLYLQRFQDLSSEFGFKPVWLTNYEMISDSRYVDFICKAEEKGEAELGMHLHAWNNPPEYNLPRKNDGAAYLIEYPYEIMDEKIGVLTELIKKRTGITPISHRAGRWAMNDDYFDLLGNVSDDDEVTAFKTKSVNNINNKLLNHLENEIKTNSEYNNALSMATNDVRNVELSYAVAKRLLNEVCK